MGESSGNGVSAGDAGFLNGTDPQFILYYITNVCEKMHAYTYN